MTAGRRVLELKTQWRTEVLEVTERVREAVRETGIARGFVHCFAPHTTAAITLNERSDPQVTADLVAHLERLVPWSGEWKHPGNAAAHVKSSLLGHAVTIAVEDGELQLGPWQGLFFCEFHGPRTRALQLTIEAT